MFLLLHVTFDQDFFWAKKVIGSDADWFKGKPPIVGGKSLQQLQQVKCMPLIIHVHISTIYQERWIQLKNALPFNLMKSFSQNISMAKSKR